MKYKLDIFNLKVRSERLLEVFSAGFSVLGIDSPMLKGVFVIHETSGVFWCMPENFLMKTDAIACLMFEAQKPDYFQFSSDHRKFNQLAAIEHLILLGFLVDYDFVRTAF